MSRLFLGLSALPFVVLMSLTGMTQAAEPLGGPASAQARAAQVATLRARIEERGSTPVLVRLREETPLPRLKAMRHGSPGLDFRSERDVRSGVKRLRDRFSSRLGGMAGKLRGFSYLPYVALNADRQTLSTLNSMDEVMSIQEDRANHITLDETTGIINAVAAWAKGYEGSGQAVAVLDTGVQTDHPFLQGRTIGTASACFSGINLSDVSGVTSFCPSGLPACTSPNGLISYPNSACGTGAAEPCSGHTSCYHGTHVSGIALGSGASFSGVAKSASLIPIQVFVLYDDDNDGNKSLLAYDSDLLAALEHVLTLSDSIDIAAVNMSLGGGVVAPTVYCDALTPAYKIAIDNLRAVGIATVIAAGNNGSSQGISYPGCVSNAVSVGATANDDSVAGFSNQSSAMTLYAPGVSVLSSVPVNGYGFASGTSMATPHVAGAIAVLKQKAVESQLDSGVDALVAALQTSGVPISDRYTVPRIDVDAALTALEENPPVSLILDSDLSGNQVAAISGSFQAVNEVDSYAGRLQRADDSPSASIYRFTPELPRAGYYRVDAYWTQFDGNGIDIRASINSGEGLDEIGIDQTADGNRWIPLAVYWFNADGSEYVELSDTTGGRLVADAVRWQSVDDLSLQIVTNTLPSLQLNQAFSTRVKVFGGTAPYQWTLTGGTLPDGLILDSASGEISGIALATGPFNFDIELSDSDGGMVSRSFTLTVTDELFGDGFDDGNFAGWTIVDEGTSDGPSQWAVSAGQLVQSTNIITKRSAPGYFGTYAFLDAGINWSDYRVSADLRSNDDDLIGIMFRVTDSDNYYRVWWYGKTGVGMVLDKRVNGVTSVLAQDPDLAYTPGQTYRLEILVQGDQIEVLVDGVPAMSFQDGSLNSGSIALYNAGNAGSVYDNVRIDGVGTVSPPTNQDPEIQSLTVPTTMLDNETVDFVVQATDPDDDDLDLTYTWTITPNEGQLSAANSATASFTPPDVTTAREYQVVITVQDGNGGEVSATRTLTVEDADPPPLPLLDETFSDGDYAGWTIVDQGTSYGPSQWSVSSGELVQSTNIITKASAPDYFGSYARYDGGDTWTDYRVALDISSDDDDLIGIMFRVTDSDNYYRLWWYGKTGVGMVLNKRVAGVTSVLAQDPNLAYQPGQHYRMEVLVEGTQIQVLVDGQVAMTVQDAALSSGSIALYCAGNAGSRFDNILVEDQSSGPPVEQPPQIVQLLVPTTLSDDSIANFSVTATDPDGNDAELSYAWSILPDEGNLAGATTPNPTYTPLDLSASRDYQVTVSVTDSSGASTSESRPMTVEDAMAVQTLLDDDFSDGDFSDWSIIDEGTSDGPSDWNIVAGELVQSTNIITKASAPNYYGTYALRGDGYAWDNYRLTMDMRSDDDDLIGAMFRVADSDNYYRLWWYGKTGIGMVLNKRVGGVTTVIASAPNLAYTPGQSYTLEIGVQGNQIEVRVDGQLALTAQDNDLVSGSIALYCAGNVGSRYDNVLVESLPVP